MTDPHNQSVVFEKDKLLEPSKDKLLEPSIDFQPPEQKEAPKSTKDATSGRGGPRSSFYAGSRAGANKLKLKKEANADIPDFLEQGQDMSCKCEICRLHLNELKKDGPDPRVLDVLRQRTRQDKFLNKQLICDQKMKELYHELKKHSNIV